jgi:hypothetical protein
MARSWATRLAYTIVAAALSSACSAAGDPSPAAGGATGSASSTSAPASAVQTYGLFMALGLAALLFPLDAADVAVADAQAAPAQNVWNEDDEQ